jgi:hypothetical protein
MCLDGKLGQRYARGETIILPERVMNYSADFKSIKNEVSSEEWNARCELAACYRLVDAYSGYPPYWH